METWTTEDELAQAHERSLVSDSMRSLLLRELETQCPVIDADDLPEGLLQGSDTCSVCNEKLSTPLPIRQL